MARKKQNTKKQADDQNESYVRIFFQGFFWPVKMIGRGLAWLSHQPPLKQVDHGLRWFFRLKAIRFVGKILGLSYIRHSWQELKGVTWPTWHESRRLTTAVIIFAIIFGVLIAGVDYGLDKLFRQVLLK